MRRCACAHIRWPRAQSQPVLVHWHPLGIGSLLHGKGSRACAGVRVRIFAGLAHKSQARAGLQAPAPHRPHEHRLRNLRTAQQFVLHLCARLQHLNLGPAPTPGAASSTGGGWRRCFEQARE